MGYPNFYYTITIKNSTYINFSNYLYEFEPILIIIRE